MATPVKICFFIQIILVNLIEELTQLSFQFCKFLLNRFVFWVTYNITELANTTCRRLELFNTTIERYYDV